MGNIGLELLYILFPKVNNIIASVSVLILSVILIAVILFIISRFVLNLKKIRRKIYHGLFYWMPEKAYGLLIVLVIILSLGISLKWMTPRDIFEAFIGAFVALYLESLLQKTRIKQNGKRENNSLRD